jgi:hypothetical protein
LQGAIRYCSAAANFWKGKGGYDYDNDYDYDYVMVGLINKEILGKK